MPGIEWLPFSNEPDLYWITDASYKIDNDLAEEIGNATFELTNMCLEAVDFVINNPILLEKAFCIHPELIPIIQ